MKKAVLALVLFGALAAYFAFDLGQYLSLENFKASQADIVAAKDANPALYIAGFFLLYVAVTGLSIPGAAIMSLESRDTSGATSRVGSLAIADSRSSRLVSDFEPGSATVAFNTRPLGAGQSGCEEVISSKIPNLRQSRLFALPEDCVRIATIGPSFTLARRENPNRLTTDAKSEVRETYLV